MKIMGFEHLEWARPTTTFVVAGAPLFLGDEVLEDGNLFLVKRREEEIALGVEVCRVMSGTVLARRAMAGQLAVEAEVGQRGGVDIIVSARLAFRSGSVWIEGRLDDMLSKDERNWRARTALAAVAGDGRSILPMPDHPVGEGEPIGIDLVGDIGRIGNRAADLAFLRQHRERSVIINIDSDGGNLEEARGIYRILASCQHAVYCNITRANSAAVLPALAADVRSIAADGQMLLHPPVFSTLDGVNARDLEIHIERLNSAAAELARIVAARSGQPIDIVAEWLSEESLFDAGSAVNAGLAHHVAYDQAPITPQAIRARFAPVNGPFQGRRPAASAAPVFAYGGRYRVGDRVRHDGQIFVARRPCFGAPGLEPDRDAAWRRG
jgi:ATP-dependent protease ClpP protease subunit